MIAVRLDLRVVQAASGAPRHAQAIRKLLDLRPHAPQILREHGDAVTFLYAKFGCISNLNSLLGIWTKNRNGRKFVNQLSDASPSIEPPFSGSWRTDTSPTSSPCSLRIETRLIGAPMDPRTSSTADRVGFSPTL